MKLTEEEIKEANKTALYNYALSHLKSGKDRFDTLQFCNMFNKKLKFKLTTKEISDIVLNATVDFIESRKTNP